MNSRYKDKLVGVYAPGNYGHTSVDTSILKMVLEQPQGYGAYQHYARYRH